MKTLSLITAIGLGMAFSAIAQTTRNDQEQQPPPSKETNAQQSTDELAPTGHSNREQMKDTSKPAKTKAGGTVTSKSDQKTNVATGGTVQSTTVFRNGKETSERLSVHQSVRDRSDTHFAIGTHPRDWWLQTYSIAVFSGCHYYLADNGCWYPAYGFDPGCDFPEGVVYCE